jgi:hypothetical protein
MTNKINRYELERVYNDNVRDNQIGGKTDGISPEVAADLGYQSPEDVLALIHSSPAPAEKPVRRRPTIAEQNRNERAAIRAHLEVVVKQQIDPRY